ncbi:MAG: 2-hydroxyacid dehydrogenase [Terriglobia bacterium]
MAARVLIARRLPEAAMNLLAGRAELDVHDDETPLTKTQLMARLADKHALICQLTQVVDAEVLAAAAELRVVANVAVGYDNIDVAAATRRRIAVTNTPGVLDETVADFTWALLLAAARRVVEGDAHARSGAWRGWDLLLLQGTDVHGKTLGLYGFGRIGRGVAARARGFGLRTLYYARHRAPAETERALAARWVERETLLRESDFLSLHVPLTPETRHAIGARELALMKPTAILINVARGPVVDEAALAAALAARQIAAAALDVFEEEPKLHPGLLTLKNVVLAPHLASASVETRTRMAVMAAENALAVLAGRRPPNLVNPEIYVGQPA